MRRVCLYDFRPMENFHGYRIESFDVREYFPASQRGQLYELFSGGWNAYFDWKKLYFADGIDKLYRSRHPSYMRLVRDFVEKFHDFDVIILATYCPIHPEILFHELKKPVKILGFVDDPFSTYVRGVPYLWAFDGAFYVSPSYSERELFSEKMEQWSCVNHTWWPLVPHALPKPSVGQEFFSDRDIDLIYVGQAYGPKIDRLIQLKKKFGSRFRIHGRWPFKGYHGLVRGLLGKPIFPHRVAPLTTDERTALYCRTKIGFNMHLSDVPRETGNMRMYETPAHGMMMICDKAGRDAHAQIFTPDEEAVYYDSIVDAIDKIEYYLANDEARLRIAKAGYDRATSEYGWEPNLKRFLDWAYSLKAAKTHHVDNQ